MSHIVSSSSGRIRVRHPSLRNPERLSRLEAKLARVEHVRSTEANPRLGCVLLHFDASQVEIAAIEAAIDAATDAELSAPPPQVVAKKRPMKMQINRYAKMGMLATLGTSLALAAAGNKRWHAAIGAGFVACLGVHLSTHYRHVFR